MQRFLIQSELQFGKSTVLVRVGQRSEHKVDEKLLRTSSAFFKAALSHEWKESQTRIIELPTLEPEDFQTYLDWLHTHRIYVSTSLDPSPEERQQELDRLVDAYLLGDYIQDIDYKDTIIDTIINWALDLPPQPTWLDMWRWISQVDKGFLPLFKILKLTALCFSVTGVLGTEPSPRQSAFQKSLLLGTPEKI